MRLDAQQPKLVACVMLENCYFLKSYRFSVVQCLETHDDFVVICRSQTTRVTKDARKGTKVSCITAEQVAIISA